jgi:hypothetical protein
MSDELNNDSMQRIWINDAYPGSIESARGLHLFQQTIINNFRRNSKLNDASS